MKQKELVMTKLHTDLWNYLYYIKHIRRDLLLAYLRNKGHKINDPQMRTAKRELIKMGYPIGSSSARKCYFVIFPGDKEGKEEAKKEYEARAKSELAIAAQIDKNAIDYWKQKTLF